MINFHLIPISVKSLKLTEKKIKTESQLTLDLLWQYAIEIQEKKAVLFRGNGNRAFK